MKLYDLAREAVAIARAGLATRALPGAGGLVHDETHFLNALEESIDSGQVPADELLEHYRGDWDGRIESIFAAYSY